MGAKSAFEIRKLELKDERAFFKAIEIAKIEDYSNLIGDKTVEEGDSFGTIVERLNSWEIGEQLPVGWVPSTTFWAFDRSGVLAGRLNIRHVLNEFLKNIGGHIGYGVMPEFRRQGCATNLLVEGLRYCRESLKLEQVLLTCDDDNLGSRKVIEKCGGTNFDYYFSEGMRIKKRRYILRTEL